MAQMDRPTFSALPTQTQSALANLSAAVVETGLITFKGDKHKVKFSKEVVPTLDAVNFEVSLCPFCL
jgi:hypothetical protein